MRCFWTNPWVSGCIDPEFRGGTSREALMNGIYVLEKSVSLQVRNELFYEPARKNAHHSFLQTRSKRFASSISNPSFPDSLAGQNHRTLTPAGWESKGGGGWDGGKGATSKGGKGPAATSKGGSGGESACKVTWLRKRREVVGVAGDSGDFGFFHSVAKRSFRYFYWFFIRFFLGFSSNPSWDESRVSSGRRARLGRTWILDDFGAACLVILLV